jgi:hypothetical protein
MIIRQSFTGVEIMRVLLANNVGRILLIAFTNHALDHLLRSVLKAGLTRKIVRLGSRSADEQIAEFSLENMERFGYAGTTDRSSINDAYWARKNAEGKLNEVLTELQEASVSDDNREEYMDLFRSEHQNELTHPPRWVEELRFMSLGWTQVGSHTAEEAPSAYEFWIKSNDINWLRAQIAVQKARHQKRVINNHFEPLPVEELEETVDDIENPGDREDHSTYNEEIRLRNQFLRQSGLTELPSLPASNRPIDELQEDPMVWLMSQEERERLDRAWTTAAKMYFFETRKESFEDLKKEYEEAHVAYDECQSQVRNYLLHGICLPHIREGLRSSRRRILLVVLPLALQS